MNTPYQTPPPNPTPPPQAPTPYQAPSPQQVAAPYQAPASYPGYSSGSLGGSKKRLKSINPLKAGLVLAVLYAILSFFFMLIVFLFGFSLSRGSGGSQMAGMGVGLVIAAPLIYGFLGLLAGVICAWVYNLVAKITGGFEFTLEDVN